MSKNFEETVRLQSEIRREIRGERLQGIAEGASSAPRLASSSAVSFPGRNECPGTHCSLIEQEEKKDSSCQICHRVYHFFVALLGSPPHSTTMIPIICSAFLLSAYFISSVKNIKLRSIPYIGRININLHLNFFMKSYFYMVFLQLLNLPSSSLFVHH